MDQYTGDAHFDAYVSSLEKLATDVGEALRTGQLSEAHVPEEVHTCLVENLLTITAAYNQAEDQATGAGATKPLQSCA